MDITSCKGFNPLDRMLCYPVSMFDNFVLFDIQYLNMIEEWVKEAFMIHTWNSQFESKTVSVNSNIPYVVLAKRYCPVVVEHCGGFL
jgi:hypothetical protein